MINIRYRRSRCARYYRGRRRIGFFRRSTSFFWELCR